MKVSTSERVAQASLILTGLMFVVPFLQPYHSFPLTAFYSEWLAFALGLAAALLLLQRAPWRDATLPAVSLVAPALALLLGLQVALGRVPYPEQALTATLYLLWAALLMLLAHVLRRELGMTAVATALAWFALGGGLLGALAGLLQHYQISVPLEFMVTRKAAAGVYGNLGQANHYAAHVILALGSAAYLHCRGSLRGAWAAACAVPLLFVLALSGSRSPWIYLTALAVLAFLLHSHRRGADSFKLSAVVFWLLLGFIAAQWVAGLPFLAPEQGAPVTSGQRLFAEAAGIEARLQLWHEAWRMFLAAPVLGAGFGQFAWHHFEFTAAGGASAAPGAFNHAHNIVLQLMAETGGIGALAVVGAVLAWLADLRRARFDPERWWMLALLAVIGIHSLLEFPLWYAYFLGVTALLLGLGAERVFALRYAAAARVTAALFLLVGGFNLVSVLPHYREFERLVFAPEPRGAPPQGEKLFAEAIERLHREPLLTPYVELAVAYGITGTDERLREKLELNSRAMRFAPADVVVFRQAQLLALAGEREAALHRLDQAARVYPGQLPEVIKELAKLAGQRPAEFAPLLKSAVAKNAEFRGRDAVR